MAEAKGSYAKKRERGLVPFSYTYPRLLRRARELGVEPNSPVRRRRHKAPKEGKHLDTIRKIVQKKERKR